MSEAKLFLKRVMVDTSLVVGSFCAWEVCSWSNTKPASSNLTSSWPQRVACNLASLSLLYIDCNFDLKYGKTTYNTSAKIQDKEDKYSIIYIKENFGAHWFITNVQYIVCTYLRHNSNLDGTVHGLLKSEINSSKQKKKDKTGRHIFTHKVSITEQC